MGGAAADAATGADSELPAGSTWAGTGNGGGGGDESGGGVAGVASSLERGARSMGASLASPGPSR